MANTRVKSVSLSRSGRPEKLTDRQKRQILRIIRKEPAIKYKLLIAALSFETSRSTIYRYLKSEGITNWVARRRLLLTKAVLGKRLAWCKARAHWEEEDWLKIIFSDECSVERGSGKQRM